MPSSTRQLLLNINLQGFGQRPASWRTQSGIDGTELITAEFWENLGRIAERGTLDAVFFADHPALENPNVRPLGLVEPFAVISAIAQATSHLGLVGSASTTYNDPVDLADRLLTLDVLSGGRVAWNAVTTYSTSVADNFGLTENPPRPVRYRRAKEFAGLVKKLWESAATGDRIAHRGEFFEVEGRLTGPASPQGRPAVFQAGGSPFGRDFAAAQADAVFSVELNLDQALEHYRHVKDLARAYGRSPHDVTIVPGLSLVLGSTEEEARRRYDALEELAPDGYTIGALGSYLEEDLSTYDLDAPLPTDLLDRPIDPVTFGRSVGYRETVVEWVRRNNTSLRDLLRNFGGYGARIIVGTPEQAADSIEEWFRAGAADGFNLMVDEFPTGLETIVDQLVPLLRDRGLFRHEYAETQLRPRLAAVSGAVDRPASPAQGFATQQVHGGQLPDPGHGSRITPIHATAGYVFEDFADARDRFGGESTGLIYTRGANPTNLAVEAKLAALEGGSDALVVASGQAATSVAVLGLAGAGDHVLSAPSIYEGTRTLFRRVFARLGIDVEFVERPNDPQDWLRRVRPTTKAFFGEAIPNPKNDLIDLAAIADAAHTSGVPFIVDSTIATPFLLRPIEHGVDIVVHSASKYLTGQGASVAGAIIDAGHFDWAAHTDRFPRFAESSVPGGPSFLERFGRRAYYVATRTQVAAELGPTLSPFNAFLLQQGLETLSTRLARQSQSALTIAQWLETRPEVTSVDYSGLDSSPYRELARTYLPHGQSAVFAFTLDGGQAAAHAFYDAVDVFTRMTHIGDVRSLILHPATTTHSRLTDAERDEAGIWPGLLRLSVGLEDPSDLIAGLEKGFAALRRR